LLGHTKLESTVRYLGVEVDDALQVPLCNPGWRSWWDFTEVHWNPGQNTVAPCDTARFVKISISGVSTNFIVGLTECQILPEEWHGWLLESATPED
ncbi:uncharacterized protein METZ01_LOCUS370598, partial [marine metagenome]